MGTILTNFKNLSLAKSYRDQSKLERTKNGRIELLFFFFFFVNYYESFSEVLRSGGNAVDAAIATMLCDSVVCPDVTGVGGGFLMTVYNRTRKSSIFVNARETAPGAAKTTMFVNDPSKSLTGGYGKAKFGLEKVET